MTLIPFTLKTFQDMGVPALSADIRASSHKVVIGNSCAIFRVNLLFRINLWLFVISFHILSVGVSHGSAHG